MGWLKDTLLSIPERIREVFRELRKADIIKAMELARTQSALDRQYDGLSEEDKVDPELLAVYNNKKEEFVQDGGLGPFGSISAALMEGFDKLKDGAEVSIADIIKTVLPSDSPALTEAFDPAIERLMDTLFDTLEFAEKKLDEGMKSDIAKKIKPMLRLVVTFEVGSWLAEWIQPMKNTGLRHVAHGLYDTVGFHALSAAYLDPIRLNLVTQPVKYDINALTKPFIPGWKDALEWYGRGHIDEDEMLSLRTKHGMEDGWDDRYQRMGTKASSYFMLNAIAREGFWDVDDFRFWLSDAGYGAFHITEALLTPYEVKYKLKAPRSTQIDFLLDAYKQMNLRSTVGDVRGIRRKLMIDGWISRKDFEDDLGRYKITQEDAKDVLDAIEMQQERKDAKELQRAFEKKYTYGRITQEELKVELTKLRLREEYIEARLTYLLTVKAGKLAIEEEKEKDLTNAQILNAWESGIKEKGWALNRIDAKGYTTEDAVTIIDIEEQDHIEDVNDEWIRTYEQRTRNLRMRPAELEKKLVKHGKSPEWAEARAAYYEEVVLGKE